MNINKIVPTWRGCANLVLAAVLRVPPSQPKYSTPIHSCYPHSNSRDHSSSPHKEEPRLIGGIPFNIPHHSFVVPAVCHFQVSSPPSRGLGLVAERIMHEDPSHQVKSGNFPYQSLHTPACWTASPQKVRSPGPLSESDYNLGSFGRQLNL